MSDVTVTRRPVTGLLALSVATALAIPLGFGAPSTAAPTHEVLLGTTGSLTEVAQGVTAAGGRVVQTFGIARALVAQLPETVSAPPGAYVIPNVGMTFNALPSATTASDAVNTFTQTINAPDNAGNGVKVAVVDTGVDPNAAVTVSDRVNVSGGPAGDGYGHGTFMAGLVAGTDDEFGGVAPKASVVDVQVAATDGSTDLRRVLAGLQAVADQRATDSSLEVVMLALSTQSPLPPYLDPLSVALNRLWARGVTVVVAAGNDGADALSSPASDPQLLVVGAQDENDTAVRSDDEVADFSAYGKAFGFVRPDVVAPGVSLISTSPVDSTAYQQNPASQVGTGFLKGTGTSMSAAVAAGAVAALVAQRPALTPDDAKRLLVGTAYRTSALTTANGAGKGGLDLGKAMATAVSAVPPLTASVPSSPNFGPNEDDAQAWADFAQGWADGDLQAVAQAWVAMSPRTRKWAANAWSLAAVMRALQSDDGTFAGRNWAGLRWITQGWKGRNWAEDEWVGRNWAGRNWADRNWAGRNWAGRNWAGRNWAEVDWLAFAWTLRMSATDDTITDLYDEWAGRNWAGRNWAGRNWAGRNWATVAWVGRNWAEDAWTGRNWADYAWDGRNWAQDDWSGRNWADFVFEGRNWATRTWNGRNWAVRDW